MTCKVKGILLRTGQTVHEECALTILTERRGCITVFARNNRKKSSSWDQFYYGEWVLYETGGGNFLLNSFSVEEPFHALKENLENTFLAGYFAQIALYFGKGEPQEAGVLLPLLLNALYLLGRGKPPRLVKSVFELKTMQLMGYCPTLKSCGHPGGFFALEDGGILCADCAVCAKTVPVTASVTTALAYILNHPPARAFSFSVPQPELVRLSRLTEEYLLYHLEIKAPALEMWKTICE